MAERSEFEYANAVAAAGEVATPRVAWVQLLAICGLLAAAVLWARAAVIEEVTTGTGRIIPSRQLQVVQSLEGGLVREILVREGDRVEAGQLLMRIDDTSFASRLGEMSTKRTALLAEVARLDAEAAHAATPKFDAALMKEQPRAVESERQAFIARRAKLDSEQAVLQQQLVQREQELAELRARRTKVEAQLKPLTRELALNRELSKRGAISEMEILRLERQHAELNGDRDVLVASIPRAEASIAEAKSRAANGKASFEAQVQERLVTARGDLAVMDEAMKAATDRVVRTALSSPVRGIVNKLTVTTIGAVLQPGQPLAEIVPLDDSLLVETRVRPQDVAFISPGQHATVKLTAYDYLIYGALIGKVERISADTIADQRGETFYQVIVRTEQSSLDARGKVLPVIPGMVAKVDIQTGEKTVLSYLLSPLLRARREALRER